VSRFYITTAIDYANGDPHLGHAFEKIGADTIARFRRLLGDEVRFCMGMDEHGQKVAQAAASEGVDPQALVDRLAGRFRAMWERLCISNDRWVRTTDAHHKRGVVALIERCLERNPGDFYEKAYEGWYCVGCELFKRDHEIVDGRCVLHPTRELQWTEERNWFFRLSRYQEFLRRHFEEKPWFLRPESRRNEILALIDGGLEDISVTRARLSWAIPFPRPTSDGVEQGTWVWFDALPNYLTDTGYPEDEWEAWWPAQLHVVGKDITRLHAVIWPAMLECAGLPLPHSVWGHGFVTLGGERFSKSAGVGLDLSDAIDRFGPDAFRYFLLREVPWDADGNFSWERFTERYNSELANSLGNLASRVISMVQRYRGGVVPDVATPDNLSSGLNTLVSIYYDRMSSLRLHDGAGEAMKIVHWANLLVDQWAPWKLVKDGSKEAELDLALSFLVRLLAVSAVLLSPFMPEKMAQLLERLDADFTCIPPLLDQDKPGWFGPLADLSVAGWQVRSGDPLFPRAESETS
jgi:methionyl-tRNA synthetase